MLRLRFALAAMLVLGAAAQGATVYVSANAPDDTSTDGSAGKPFRTITRALAAVPTQIVIAPGDYLLDGPLTIPPGVAVVGGRKPVFETSSNTWRWFLDDEATNLLAIQSPGVPAITLGGVTEAGQRPARLEGVRIFGGFASVQAGAGAELVEVELAGGVLASILIPQGAPALAPTVVERCRITGGGTGILVEGSGHAVVRETLVQDTVSRGMFVTGSGAVTVTNSVFQRNDAEGIAISGNSNVAITNSVVRRNRLAGLSVVQANPVVMGCLAELNEHGLFFQQSPSAVVRNSTSVSNRRAGVYLDRSTPVLENNIIALNTQTGVEEGLRDVLQGGALRQNFFWNNPTQYLDQGTTPTTTLEGFAGLRNTVAPSGNVIEDPLFVSTERGDYRLRETSPAVDFLPADPEQTEDLDGNLRAVDLPSTGGLGNFLDVGAFETQVGFKAAFAAQYYDESFVQTGPDTTTVRKTPGWEWSSVSPFNTVPFYFLPGRIRMWPRTTDVFSGAYRRAEDVDQPADKVARMRFRVAQVDGSGLGITRMRVSGPEANDTSQLLSIPGNASLGPLAGEGREYEFHYDFRQGALRDIPVVDDPSYKNFWFVDLMDFSDQIVTGPVDVREVSIDYIDRAGFDAQFTQTVFDATFTTGDEGWRSGTILVYEVPTFAYDGTKGGLTMTFNRANTYGAWFREGLSAAPGKLVRVEALAAFEAPTPANRPPARLRLTAEDFSWSLESVMNTLDATPRTYVMYFRIPTDAGAMNRFSLNFELFGFSANKSGTLLLDRVKFTTTP